MATQSTVDKPHRDAAPTDDASGARLSGPGSGLADLLARLAPLPWLRFSSITSRVLAVNLIAIFMLAMGLLYLDRYKQNLVRSQLESLAMQGGVFAAALGEAAVTTNSAVGQDSLTSLARPMVRRLAVPARVRARLFAANGDLIADSQYVGLVRGGVQVAPLPPPSDDQGFLGALIDAYEWLVGLLPSGATLPVYVDNPSSRADDYPEVQKALTGENARSVRAAPAGGLVLSVAVPVQRYKQVLGALMLSVDSEDIEESLRGVRVEILSVLGVVLVVIVLASLWLAGTIARPVRRLSAAAERVRGGLGQAVEIPDLTARGDEIGKLSASLRDMTAALWTRMDAIEGFAADVAHEIKNPLSSLRSAVETAARVTDPDKQRRLMAIILDDVQRLDRLITDISDASRLDAELGRARLEDVNLSGLLATLVEVEQAACEARGPGAARITFEASPDGPIIVHGIEDRLVQVFRNLIANAVSFSPPGGVIRIAVRERGDAATVTVEDQGPGIPEGKLEAIFDRFYSERPPGEKFGTHSGLGLSISKQIVDAHRGRIRAENLTEGDRVTGARFTVELRLAEDD